MVVDDSKSEKIEKQPFWSQSLELFLIDVGALLFLVLTFKFLIFFYKITSNKLPIFVSISLRWFKVNLFNPSEFFYLFFYLWFLGSLVLILTFYFIRLLQLRAGKDTPQ